MVLARVLVKPCLAMFDEIFYSCQITLYVLTSTERHPNSYKGKGKGKRGFV